MTEYQDVRETTTQLAEMRENCPSDFYFIKGYIHCAIQNQLKKKKEEQQDAKECIS